MFFEKNQKVLIMMKKLKYGIFFIGGCRGARYFQVFAYLSYPPLCNSLVRLYFLFLNKTKNLDLSYKTDLDFWSCFGG